MDNTDHYTGALLEDINHKLDLIMELIKPIPQMQQDIAELKADMIEVKADIRVMKAAIADLSKYNNKHERTFGDIGRSLLSYATA